MSLPDVMASGDIQSRAKAFFHFVERPVEHATLFYTTYWLTEVKGVEDARFDFARLRDTSHKRLIDYGIYSVLGEVINVYSAFSVDDKQPMNLEFQDATIHDLADRLIEVFNEKAEVIGPRSPEQDPLTDEEEEMVRMIFTNAQEVRRIRTESTGIFRDSVVETCATAEDLFDAFSRPEPFLRACQRLFNFGYHESIDTGWHTNYGGPAWGAICRHLLRADAMPTTAWVDTSWGIQHNNANWMNKIRPSSGEINHLETLADFPEMLNPRKWVYTRMLPAVLDWNKEGRWDDLYPLAVTYDESVHVNLRRLARPLGIDLPPGEEGIIHTTAAGSVEEIGPAREVRPAKIVVATLPNVDEEGTRLDVSDPRKWAKELAYAIKGRVMRSEESLRIVNLSFSGEGAPPPVDVEINRVEPSPGDVGDETEIVLRSKAGGWRQTVTVGDV